MTFSFSSELCVAASYRMMRMIPHNVNRPPFETMHEPSQTRKKNNTTKANMKWMQNKRKKNHTSKSSISLSIEREKMKDLHSDKMPHWIYQLMYMRFMLPICKRKKNAEAKQTDWCYKLKSVCGMFGDSCAQRQQCTYTHSQILAYVCRIILWVVRPAIVDDRGLMHLFDFAWLYCKLLERCLSSNVSHKNTPHSDIARMMHIQI